MRRLAVLGLAAALALVACGGEATLEPPPPPPEVKLPPEVRLYTMDCGRFRTSDAGMFSDQGAYDGVSRTLVNPCFLVRHPDGDLMWDTGVPDAFKDNPPPATGAFTIRLERTLVEQLAEIAVAPGDIDYVSFSHSHFDHVGNANLFTNATWIADEDEFNWMFRPEARQSQEFASYRDLEAANRILIEGEASHDVFGDGSVVIHQAPGHTPGHTVLMLKFARSGPVLLTGDMWHLAEARERRTVPVINTDREQTLASMDKVEEMARKMGARVIRQHVREDFESLPDFPSALE